MKKISVLVVLLAMCSCSKNDSEAIDNSGKPDPNDLITTTYLPTANAIWWKYNTTTTEVTPAPVAPATGITTGLDQLNVDSDLSIADKTYKLMKTTAAPTGFYNTMLNNNKLRVDGSSIKLTGNVIFNLGSNSIPLSVNDLTIFKENAVAGTTLSTPQSGTQNFTVPNLTQVIIVNYTLKAVADNDLATLSIGTTNYINVKVVKLIVTIDANIVISTDPLFTTQALNPISQDVIVSTQYWVKNIGVVKADTTVKYALARATAGIPQNGEQSIIETLNSKSF